MMALSLTRDEELEANRATISQQMHPAWGHIDLALCSEGKLNLSDG